MERITMLGTGHAMTFDCFNTCFIYENENGKMLVDTGGGNGLLKRLRQAGIDQSELDAVFISHRHTDHICGLPWLLRSAGGPGGGRTVTFYLHPDVLRVAKGMLELFFPDDAARAMEANRFVEVQNGDEMEVLGRKVRFVDLHSPNVPQFGFVMTLENGERLVFHGDVPFHESNRQEFEGADWLLHEAFNLSTEHMGPPPGGKGGPGGPGGQPPMGPPPGGKGPGGPGHSTVKQAASYAQSLHVRNLVLFHGSDNDLESRKARYTAEAETAFSGRIFVPDDLDVIELT